MFSQTYLNEKVSKIKENFLKEKNLKLIFIFKDLKSQETKNKIKN